MYVEGNPVCRVGFGVAVELEHPRKDNTAQLLLECFAFRQWEYHCILERGRLRYDGTYNMSHPR